MQKYLTAVFGPSWRTTLIGYLGAALVEGALALEQLPGNAVLWHLAAVFLAAFGRAMKDSAVTGGSVAVTPEAKIRLSWPVTKSSTEGGSNGPGPAALLALLFVLGAGAPGAARAEAPPADPTAANSDPGAVIADAVANAGPDRRFGGCFQGGAICLGPSVSLSLVAWDLGREQFVAGFDPGVGYGVTFWANRWHQVGLSAGAALSVREGSVDAATLSAVLSFAEYLRVGYGYEVVGARDGVGSSRSRYLLLGIGADFGK